MAINPLTRPTVRKIAYVACVLSPIFPPASIFSLYWSIMLKFTTESMGEVSRYNILIGANVMLLILSLAWWAGLWITAGAFNSSGLSFGTLTAGTVTAVFLLLDLRVVYRSIFLWGALPLIH